jgi:4-amino-4-deoxy-L-arabinose transferase-like glycosyltransferase
MSVMNAALDRTRLGARSRVQVTALAAPAVLYVVALAVRVAALWIVPYTLNEGSAYYVNVARNIATGRGPVIDALWSYGTPPLTLPRAAFELWQPFASYLAAAPMALLGPSLSTAQLAFALFGALLAPLTWWIAKDAAKRLALPADRQRAVALGCGLLAAVAAPLVLAAAVPDSTLPFTVLAAAACVAIPIASRGNGRAIVALGVLLGVAYLTRIEAIYLGLVFVAFAWSAGARGRQLLARVGAVTVIGALIVLPWWLRNLATFGTPMPGQLAQNLFLTRNDQIFAFTDQPTLAGFLGQGPATIVSNIGAAAAHDFVDVLLIPAVVVVVVGIAAALAGWRRRLDLSGTPLAALIVYGMMAFVVTTALFPVATLWGTFAHAAGPLILALTVLAVLGADAFVARVRQWRHWSRANLWLAPAALIALSLPMTVFQLASAGQQAHDSQQQVAAAANLTRADVALDATKPVISDEPIWLSDALGVPAIELPDESGQSVLQLARQFGAGAIVIVDTQGHDPASLAARAPGCFTLLPSTRMPDASGPAVLSIAEECR